jgi:lipoyl-dependent peroxiredoxin
MDRKAKAIWKGGIKNGEGALTTESQTLKDTKYSFKDRFEEGKGTNPEELLAAAHAGCFAMALSFELDKVNIVPKKLEATCIVSIDQVEGNFVITKSHIDLLAHIPQGDKDQFEKAVKIAEKGCPVSKLFKAVITVTPHLVR